MEKVIINERLSRMNFKIFTSAVLEIKLRVSRENR